MPLLGNFGVTFVIARAA